jgi:hypothetical protein
VTTGAFSNSGDWIEWSADHCDRCLRDALYQAGATTYGCPILLRSLTETPPQWVLPDPELGGSNYTCLAIRPRGTAKDGGPLRRRPLGLRPPSRGMLPLFPVSQVGPVVPVG